MLEDIRQLQRDIANLNKLLNRITTKQVTQKPTINKAKNIVDSYFRVARSKFVVTTKHDIQISKIDNLMQMLLELTHKKSVLSTYKDICDRIRKESIELEKSALFDAGDSKLRNDLNGTDNLIINTLKKVCPSAALSYEQATIDMSADQRLSWRGPATDYREALRECLDILAPDDDVMNSDGFKLEKDASKPTMKQKAQYILKVRQQTRNAIKPVQDSISIIEESVGTFVRSVYNRASISTHTPTEKSEVVRVRDQVRTVLCELLEIS